MVPPMPANDVAATLALAVISASEAPLLLLDERFTVVALSESFCRAYGVMSSQAVGRPVFALEGGTWDLPRLRSLLGASLSGGNEMGAYRMDLETPDGPTRQLELHCTRLASIEASPVRLLLTVVDITEGLAAEVLKANLIREKEVLLQEVQHRVANSLQIIASVLLQNARKVQSDESRMHLKDAHLRVLSVAAVQKQLAASALGSVALKPYFTQLCESLGASMIADHEQLTIRVGGDDSATSAETSVSLGLIVTELVINALKHAFPRNRKGSIEVEYQSNDAGWSLSIRDDGVGMSDGRDRAKAGLGTNIVNALATQLSATVRIVDMKPGAGVTIAHVAGAPVADQPRGEDVVAV